MILSFKRLSPRVIDARRKLSSVCKADLFVLEATLAAVCVEHIPAPERHTYVRDTKTEAGFLKNLSYRGLCEVFAARDATARQFPGRAEARIACIAGAQQQHRLCRVD